MSEQTTGQTGPRVTREEWLEDAIARITTAIFEPADVIVPLIKVSVSKPSGRSRSAVIDADQSADGVTYHIFISSELWEKSTILETLFGELVYAIAGPKPPRAFKHQFSLTRVGKRWYPESGSETAQTLAGLGAAMGEYPHVATVPAERLKQTTRMRKIVCPAHEKPVILRGSREAFDGGLPYCYCGQQFVMESKETNNDEPATEM